ncbi:DNA polymerase III alpha subunit DnaE [Erysipelotrichaceae bacterium]|nr:DNA polymerase III alpha subunit DnaE [Erysipelotrichaceae bacterium]
MTYPCKIVAFKSNFSLLESSISLDKMLDYAQEEGISHLIITDTNMMSGVIEFYHRAKVKNIIPYIGLNLVLADIEITLIAQCHSGYQALLLLSSRANSYQSQADFSAFLPDIHDLILIVKKAETADILALIEQPNIQIFLDDGLNLDTIPTIFLDSISFPIANCLSVQQKHINEILAAIKHGQSITSMFDYEDVILPTDIINERFQTILLSKNITLNFQEHFLPAFAGTVSQKQALFLNLCTKGAKKRYGEHFSTIHKQRLAYEITVIQKMGFVDYFLIIWDVMKFAKKEDIIIGPGRGSAVGSIVSYVLGITKIDPLRYGLIFERFLNIERNSLPDIDIDVEDSRRAELIQYLRQKYGKDHVTQILTFGTFGARSAVRDVAKAYGLEQQKITALTKQLKNSQISIVENIKENPKLAEILKLHADFSQIFKIASEIEGFPRHTSIHAAGVILTSDVITRHLATIETEKDIFLTQATMENCERVGLLKMDFLGLRNLSIIRRIAVQVDPTLSAGTFIETKIFDDDPQTFSLLCLGATTGIFQLESPGMRRVLQKVRITEFSDIATILSLYRPGPMQFIDEYADRKNNGKKYTAITPQMESILDDTFGIIIYQEQIMEIVQVLAGMSFSQADTFRRAISKKDRILLDKQYLTFSEGTLKNNISPVQSDAIFSEIVTFANYGFNKSHALAYAKISYQMAFLKTHYPAYFMCELINSVLANELKVASYLKEAMQLGLQILPPDVTISNSMYTVESHKHIRMGLASIKGLGSVTIKQLLAQRSIRQFSGFGDFLTRSDGKLAHDALISQLIYGYAFNRFSKNQKALENHFALHKMGIKFQGNLIQITDAIDTNFEDYLLIERMENEIKAFGFAQFAHPLSEYPANNPKIDTIDIRYIDAIVLIEKIKVITTKTKKEMAFLTVSDRENQIEIIAFPEVYTKIEVFLRPKRVASIRIRIQTNAQAGTSRILESLKNI